MVPTDERVEGDLEALHVRRPADLLDVSAFNALHPDGLPDAGGARIPERMRVELPILLSARLREVMGIILYTNSDSLFPRLAQRESNVSREWSVATLMECNQVIVDPDLSFIVDGAEVQQHAATLRGNLEVALIPACAMEAAVADAARRRFGRKGHDDLQRPLCDVV